MRNTLKFGEDLELDLRAYELRRSGLNVKLERIPMEILLLLVEHRPELVTREEISERVWGQDVYVDTDNSINGAIRKIRQALRDDPENPRFILTVTAKGYRFIAPVAEDETARPVATVLPPEHATPQATAPQPAGKTPRAAPPQAATPQAATPQSVGRNRLARRWVLLLSAVVVVTSLGAYLHWAHPTTSSKQHNDRLMLAVLPFENLTGDPAQDYFSDGFTEEMITRLGAMAPKRLGVIARTSVMYYKEARAPLDRLGRELGVQYVLEGSVRREAERVRITAQLIRVTDQSHVWARQYDREQKDVLRLQEEIAEEIGDQVELALDPYRATSQRPATLSTQGYAAYDAYLKGLHYWNLRTRDGFQRAIASFQTALAGNPDDARSFVGLADSYALMGTYNYAPRDEVFPKARDAALRALEIDESLAPAHTALALINEFYDWDWQTAGDRFRRAIELDPNYATGHHWYAEYLAFQGRFDEALAEIERARRLDPQSTSIAADYGAVLYFSRQYDRAIEQFRAVRKVDPDNGRAHLIVPAYIALGRLDEAQAEVSRWKAVQDGPWPRAFAAHIYGRLGKPAEAQLELRRMEELNPSPEEDPLERRTLAYVGMGLKDEALASLGQACARRSGFLTTLKVDPLYDPLRGDPRFVDALRCADLAR